MQFSMILVFLLQQWTAPFQVSPDTLPGSHAAVISDCWGGTWVSWYSSRSLWSRSWDGGTWSEPILVESTKAIYPEVTTSSMCRDVDRNAVVAWVDTSHSIRLSVARIRKDIWITTAPDLRIKGENPSIASDASGNIWCAWTMLDTAGTELYYQVSHYDGREWHEPMWVQRIYPVEISYTSAIATDRQGNIWVSYNDERNIWVQYWGGKSWSAAETIGTCFDYAYPAMCADSARVWIVWFNSTANMGQGGIFARYRDGVEWSALIEFPHHFSMVPMMGWHNSHADICVNGSGELWAGWWETQAMWCPNYAILANRYANGNWERTSAVDSVVGRWGGYPSICSSAKEIWMVWQAEDEGDWNIYTAHTEMTSIEENLPPSPLPQLTNPQNYPNPFSVTTSLSYSLTDKCEVTVSVYDTQGRLIATLLKEDQCAGVHAITWDGTDDNGRKVPSGTYFLSFALGSDAQVGAYGGTEHYTGTRKVTLVR
ncbi:hypothetical protein AMJ40_07910 [candidate division TA06 bacterium DG_26]|uniref:FlgD/Vpr Ig-like domain-containing protein n=1 Tax=candidate division TA06 bacterium DG_26 TaxID=1703771 RepID=A0A0S7WDF2_UNCT6|nr:MAG: hypothetical protein AMJ40_07910 [candidate division TA06 bacterium DG_26]